MSDNFLRSEIVFPEDVDKIIIGISGGADSVALTHILFSKLPAEKLLCAHVNHGIRGQEALRDENFVRDFCQSLGLELKVLHADVPKLSKEWGMGEEECGRKVRYDFFHSLAPGDRDIIVTAHNADDNAETVLLNLIRGAGLKGLSGIPRHRDKIYRPILSMTRAEVEAYCRENCLDYVTDSSNLRADYTRNKLRLQVLPVLKELNPALTESVERSSGIAAEVNEYMEQQAEACLSEAKLKSGLDCKVLRSAHQVVLKAAVKAYLESMGCGRLESKHLVAVAELIRSSGSLNVPGRLLVTVKQDTLTVTNGAKQGDFSMELMVGDNALPGGKTLRIREIQENFRKNSEKINNLLFYNTADYDRIISGLVAGHRKEGDIFTLQKRKVTKTLKKLMNELKIPAALRDRVIVVRDAENVVFVEGIGVNEKYKVDEKTSRILLFEVIEEDT